MSRICKVRIYSRASDRIWADAAAILEGLLPVRFASSENGDNNWHGKVYCGCDQTFEATTDQISGPSLEVPPYEIAEQAGLKERQVYFADNVDVPFPFRGRTLHVKVLGEPQYLSLKNGERVLAKTEHGIIWSTYEKNGVRHFKSALAIPPIPAEHNLHDVLNGDRFLEMLPLLHFVRQVCKDQLFESPPLRAGFMFDDPNLHWPKYGLVDYSEIVSRGTRENYHVSFATIPLDAWFTHGPTAEIFRKNPARLSLCVHGNDHTKRELAQNYTQPGRVALLRQAVRRIERLERKTQLKVSRVMVPPHGACSHEMLTELSGCGFEAACISHGSLRSHNRGKSWTRSLGYLPAEWIEGTPVLPRWGFSASAKNTVLLAAYLNQPMILRGHHQDLAEGVELLDELARFINNLGHVRWGNMTEISRMNYHQKMDGSTLRVQPFGRKLTLEIPQAATELLIESAASNEWRINVPGRPEVLLKSGDRLSIPPLPSYSISLEIAAPTPTVNGDSPERSMAAAFVRRILTEGRDRLFVR